MKNIVRFFKRYLGNLLVDARASAVNVYIRSKSFERHFDDRRNLLKFLRCKFMRCLVPRHDDLGFSIVSIIKILKDLN